MSYLGKTQLKASDVKRFNVTGSTSATHTLTWTTPNEQSLFVTINGVKQQEDAYSIAGSPTVVTLTSALVTTDKLEIVGIVDVGETTVPGSNTVDTASIQTDAVTNAKMADDAVGIAELSATGTASSSTFLRGDNSWVAAGRVLQVVVQSTISTGSFANTSGVVMSQSFTPTDSSSKVLVMLHINCEKAGSSGTYASLKIRRDTTSIGEALNTVQYNYTPGSRQPIGTFIYDSPATSSAVTYDLYHTNISGSDTYHYGSGVASLVMMEIDV